MPQMKPIVIKDGLATPVDHTFTPKRLEDGIKASFEEAVGVPMARNTLLVTVRPPVNGQGMYRVRVEVADPLGFTDPSSGATAVRATNRSVHEFLIHESSSEQEIKNMWAFARNALDNADVKECITTLTPLF